MKWSIFILTCVYFQSHMCINLGDNPKLNDYLNKQSRSVRDIVSITNRTDTNNVDVKETGHLTYPGIYKSAAVFTFFNTTFLLVENKLSYIMHDEGQFIIKDLPELPNKGDIIFSKAVLYKNVGILLNALHSESHIFGFHNTTTFSIQTISTPHIKDAHFFTNNGNLYFIVVDKQEPQTETTIYKWLGSHFDAIQTIATTGAMKIYSFPSKSSEILIVLQHLPDRTSYSSVYDFSLQKAKKIQHLRTSEAINVNIYPSRGKTFVVIFDKSKSNSIFLWDGSKLVKTSQVETTFDISKSIVLQSNASSIIVAPLNDRLQVFLPISNHLELKEEKVYPTNNSIVLDIHTQRNLTFVVTLNEDSISINVMSFKLRFSEADSHVLSKDVLANCLDNLEINLYDKRRRLKSARESFNKVKATHRDDSEAILKEDGTMSMGQKLDNLQSRLEKIQPLVDDYQDFNSSDILIKGKAIIKGAVDAEKLTAKNIDIQKINDNRWVPEQWLKYEEPQTITGPVKISSLMTEHFETVSDDPLFTDLLLKNGNQEIPGTVAVNNLTADRLLGKTINDVPLEDLYLKQDPQPIRGLKTFRNFKTNTAKIDLLNKKAPDSTLLQLNTSSSEYANFDSHVTIENLTVEWIDDVHWDEFRNSVFRIGKTTEINGDLTFSQIKAKRLNLKTLKGLTVEDLFTTSTDQIIEADIEFNRIFAENIEANLTNNIDLGEVAARFGDTTTIEAPIKFDRLFVRKDLELVGELDESFFLQNEDHIIGTNESDLLQIYNGSIKIKGNLYLKNVTLQPDSKLIVSETEMNPDFRKIYWTKSSKQTIPVHFEALNGISAPHLLTDKLNGVDFSQYMLNDDRDRFETSFHFENASIKGDITLNEAAKHTPDLKEIYINAVRTNGSFIIKGTKSYTNTLRVENFTTEELDGIEISDTLTTDGSGKLTGKKKFTNITIKGNLKSDIQSLEYINGINVSDFLEKVIYVDRPQNLGKLHFKQLKVDDLYVTKLNDHPINEYTENLEKMYSSEKINNLRIDGNVTINSVKNLSKINDLEFEVLLNNSGDIDEFGRLNITLEFLGHVKVENLITSNVNDIHLKTLTDKLLYRNTPQTITAPYSFTNIKTENITASKINDYSIENLVDVSTKAHQTIYAPNGIEFSSVTLEKSLKANSTSPCDLVVALKSLADPPTQQWSKIEVKGNVTLLDTENTLFKVFEKAVTTNSDHTIQAPVAFAASISAQNVTTSKHINDVDIEGIVEDAVVADSAEEQVITGQKIFTTLNVLSATVVKNADSPVLNRYLVSNLNKRIVKKNGDEVVIRGKKTFFGGLQCDNFYSKKVSNIDTENLVSMQNPRKIPTAVFDTFEVENDLNITSVNRVDLNNILQNRLLTEGPGQHVTGIYYFDNMEVENLETPSINDIEIDDVVFDTGKQDIYSQKEFLKTVEIFGNANSEYINNVNVLEAYKKSLKLGNETHIDGSIINLRPAVVNGYINAENINGFPVGDIKAILHEGTTRAVAQSLHSMKNDIINIINRYIYNMQVIPSDYMYLEKSDALQISVPNTVTAKAIASKDYVLIHVTGEESGEYCGLPNDCKCPIQYSLEVSPEHSVTIFPNKGSQRVFSFDDDGMIIHLLTNSVSTDSRCRTHKSKVMNEVSMLNWNTIPTKNTTGAFYQYDKFIQGFISGAEFFTLNGKSYAIIARYYDPLKDTHDLDCTLFKFSENKTRAEEIQKIPTKGAWSLYLFHTAQGVTLIIGNIKYSGIHHEEETEIYRFKEDVEQFELLRSVTSYGCSLASGVVLGTDSLIVLVHTHAPLQVLKYDHYYDNYFFYQSFELDTPVVGMSVFYTAGFGISDAYLCIVTGNDNYFIYSFQFIEGWKLESSGELEGLRNLIPFELNNQPYLFAPSTKNSNLLTVVKHGSV